MSERSPALRVDVEPDHDVPILTVCGVLDSSTYRTVRDSVIKAAIEAPRAVIVDVNGLHAPSVSAWTVFTSARWHVSVWPDVPILLVRAQPHEQRAIAKAGVTRYVPVHASRKDALDAVHDQPLTVRRRARAELPRSRGSIDLARGAVVDWLTGWGLREVTAIAATVATVFVENVLDHTESAPVLIVESYRNTVTVSVLDNSAHLPSRHEDAERGAEIASGLAIVSAVSRCWGATPTASGKAVWASVGRENRL